MAISLKKGEKVSLNKQASGLGEILVNLNWNSRPKNQGFLSRMFSGFNSGIDLDLGCLYELNNGEKGIIQALGKAFGSFRNSPYIALDGDDRTGNVETGENLRINGDKIAEIKRVIVFTYIYEGVVNWHQADAAVTIKYPGAEDLILKMDNFNSSEKMCALAIFENQNNQTFSVEKLMNFYTGHRELDAVYHWGLEWASGHK